LIYVDYLYLKKKVGRGSMGKGSIEVKPTRVIVARLDPGKDLIAGIRKAAERHGVKSGSFSAVGVLGPARVGYFDKATKSYRPIEFKNWVELVSCNGLITQKNGKTDVHAHMVVADEDGNAHGGHALDGCRVNLTCELVIYEFDRVINRKPVPRTNRYVLDL